MSPLLCVVLAGLLGVWVYCLIKLLQQDREEQRWWRERIEDMKGKSAWKP